jgi:DNA-directed RNA polymerase specialized sigma24 family protein
VKLTTRLSDPKIARFSDNYDSFYSLVFSIVLSKVTNYDDAEDICQEVFIRFYRKIDEIESPRKWLLGCLRIVVLDYYKVKKSKDVDVDMLFDDMSMSYVNGFRDTRIMITQALQEIYEHEGDRDAALFDLITLHNYSFVQASKQLDLNYKQALYRYEKICEKLKAKLKERGIQNIEDLL